MNGSQKIDNRIDLKKKYNCTTITIVLILPYTRVPITLKMRSRPILRYFSLLDINFCNILKQKSLATHHRYAYLLQISALNLTKKLIRLFFSKCDYNLIQYQILQIFICMERSACHKMFFKRTKCQYFKHSPRASETVLDSFGGHSCTRVPRCYTKRVCCKKYHLSWCDLNETFLQWS